MITGTKISKLRSLIKETLKVTAANIQWVSLAIYESTGTTVGETYFLHMITEKLAALIPVKGSQQGQIFIKSALQRSNISTHKLPGTGEQRTVAYMYTLIIADKTNGTR
jgi:hypothetical protein